jgi:hypothetical protein
MAGISGIWIIVVVARVYLVNARKNLTKNEDDQ